ncbi:hypothetical protein AVEN_204831-1 [Araneus ventricosus]|uniref:Uncharacterized protein n=1 Tax=Araneus ventricosus TaxID=182803 RepID=A0A4Y2Q7R3_ARAVE|nr:hypothetical protein AVEN_204831-1 [Araneus ventricosus]
MLTMVKDHVIKYHKKPSPRPDLAPRCTLNDRPPRIGQCGSRIIAPIANGSCDDPHFTGVRLVKCRSLRNESSDPDLQKERLDPISTKKKESAKRNESDSVYSLNPENRNH